MPESRWPLYAAVLGSAAYVGAVESGMYHPSGNSPVDAVVFCVTVPAVAGLSLALGLLPSRIDSVLGLAVLTGALMWHDPNPLPAMITIGFWLVGVALRSQRRLALHLRGRAEELRASEQAYAEQAVRYERTQMARELHDIVAHNLSVIVIQASAGARLAHDDPTAAAVLRTIADLTDQVHADLGGLTTLLAEPERHADTLTRPSVQALLARTSAVGSSVTADVPDDLDTLPGALRALVYRIVEEGLTNSIKHAPGAPVHVTIAVAAGVSVLVTNGAAGEGTADPAVPGAGRGITGLTERVHAAGGTLASGPAVDGGWGLRAELPRT
jgi:signal transduction histidine kinase